MTKDRFFDAFGQIEPTYVLAAGDILYGGKEVRKPPVRAVRTILIAAAIAVLMTLTAYAAGWNIRPRRSGWPLGEATPT